jgi:hypothetical protein
VQGFLFSRPVEASKITAMLTAGVTLELQDSGYLAPVES